MEKGITNEDIDNYFFFESKKKGLYLDFENFELNFEICYSLSSFSIINRNSNINILGVTLTIGDSIDKLKNVKIDYKNHEIYFTPADSDCCIYLRIKFDPKTKKITEINYYSGTD